MIKDKNCPLNQSNSKNYYVTLDTKLVLLQVCVQSVQFPSNLFDITTPHCTIPNTLLQFKQLLQDCLQYDTLSKEMHISHTYNCDLINKGENSRNRITCKTTLVKLKNDFSIR